jgi:hypothetical protein
VSGKKGDIERLKKHFIHGRPNLDDEMWNDINVVAGALKLFFRELPNPLLTFELYDRFIQALNGLFL